MGEPFDRNKFNVFVKKVDQEVEKLVALTVSDAAAATYTNVKKNTPLQTGRARSAWRIALNFQRSGDPGPLPTRKERRGQGAVTGANLRGQVALQGPGLEGEFVQIGAEYKPFKDTIYIHNDVPYIVDLELGSSERSPGGFVLRAMDRFHTMLSMSLRKRMRELMQKDR